MLPYLFHKRRLKKGGLLRFRPSFSLEEFLVSKVKGDKFYSAFAGVRGAVTTVIENDGANQTKRGNVLMRGNVLILDNRKIKVRIQGMMGYRCVDHYSHYRYQHVLEDNAEDVEL